MPIRVYLKFIYTPHSALWWSTISRSKRSWKVRSRKRKSINARLFMGFVIKIEKKKFLFERESANTHTHTLHCYAMHFRAMLFHACTNKLHCTIQLSLLLLLLYSTFLKAIWAVRVIMNLLLSMLKSRMTHECWTKEDFFSLFICGIWWVRRRRVCEKLIMEFIEPNWTGIFQMSVIIEII